MPAPSSPLSRRAAGAARQTIGFLMQQGIENPQVLSLAAGFVDGWTLPTAITAELAASVLANPSAGRNSLQYGTPAGLERLRGLIVDHLANLQQTTPDELPCSLDQVLVTNGSQQLLSLACEALLDPGDICLVAAPTYFVFLGTLSGVCADIRTIPTTSAGIDANALEHMLRELEASGELSRLKLLYLVTYADNPRGVSFSAGCHDSVAEIVRRWSPRQPFYVLEDAAYRELYFHAPPPAPLWSRIPERTIFSQTFSKTFAPGLRSGFGVVPRELIAPLTDRKSNEDFGSSSLCHHILAEALARGYYATHVAQLRDAYRDKAAAMLAALDREFAGDPRVSWLPPEGGLYCWVRFAGLDTGFDGRFFEQAVKHQQVMYVPGQLFYPAGDPLARHDEMRLSYGVLPIEKIQEGIRRLGAAWRSMNTPPHAADSA